MNRKRLYKGHMFFYFLGGGDGFRWRNVRMCMYFFGVFLGFSVKVLLLFLFSAPLASVLGTSA